MAGLLKKIEESAIDRRKFIGLAATAGVVASLGLTGCDNKVAPVDSGSPKPEEVDPITGGEWVTFNCPSSQCSMRCVNQAYVVDGVIIRQRTDELQEDSVDNPQRRGCLKGRSMRHFVTAADRLKYPMKRKSWQPGGGDNIHGELRGVDEWERISWDDAIKYIADEFTRIRDTYGNRAFLGLSQGGPSGMVGSQILNLMGGCLTTFGQQSQGGAPVVANFIRGLWNNGGSEAQDRIGLRSSKLIVYFGNNPAWNTSTGEMYDFLNAKKKGGTEIIFIDPWFNPTAQALADQWIPIRPSTDGALVEALAYEIIQNGWLDQDFLDRCTLGFDSNHMPDDAKTNENFKDYILGVYDGQPKTPEWASPITGVSVEIIKALAKKMGTTKPLALRSAIGLTRTYYGNRFAQLFYTLGWLLGNIGAPGAETTTGVTHFGTPDAKKPLSAGGTGYKNPPNPICTEPRGNGELTGGSFDPTHEYGIAYTEIYKSIVRGKYTIPGPVKGATRDCDIKCIYREYGSCITNQESGAKWVQEAFRKVEFVAIPELFLTADAQYADIVLPAITSFEIDFSYNNSSAEFILFANKVLEPYYEGKHDLDILYLLADKLGFDEDVLPRLPIKQLNFNVLKGSTISKGTPGDNEPLVSITDADLKFYGVTGEPQEGRFPVQEFMKTGVHHYVRSEKDSFVNVFGTAFREDPDANPVKTKSGKLEIYCQSLKDYYDAAMLHDIDALPKYKPMVDGYEQAKADPTYPFQLITQHQLRQVHSMYSNVRQLNEVFPNDLLISEYDAKAKGFATGDWVVASAAEGGKILRRVNAIPNLMPGVVLLGEGNWYRIDQASDIDIGGNVNTVSRSQPLGDGYQAYNTILLKIEKFSGNIDLVPDYKRPVTNPISV
jgi:anaerobic dimethyl sulfoxide reductase subunit A